MAVDDPDYDVAIIGAGAAGLAASCLLTQSGLSVALIEARDRIGGRLLTLRPYGSVIPLELGAAFVHGRPPATMAVVRAASATLYELGGQLVSRFHGQWQEDDWGEENPILESLAGYQGDDVSLGAYMATHFAAPQWEEASQRARNYIAGFDAADPETVSIRWLAQSQKADQAIQSDRQFFLLDGYDRLAAQLLDQCDATRLRLHLNAVVQQVTWVPQRVTIQAVSVVSADGAEGEPLPPITARRAIVTAPLGVLKARVGVPGAIRFNPMPPELENALAGIAMGEAARVVLRFRDRFWDRDPPSSFHHPHLSFLLSDHPVMPTWWTNYPLLVPFLTGWVGGPRAMALLVQSDREILTAAIDSLAEILGWSQAELASQVIEGYFHNWSRDPYARGAYSYVKAGGLDRLIALVQPMADTLYFAGEATNTEGHIGTVHGALATGERAAEYILSRGTSPR